MIIPSSVKTIGESAFAGCNGLTTVTILNPDILAGKNVFSSCFRLKSVLFPNSETSDEQALNKTPETTNEMKQDSWTLQSNDGSNYYSQKADSLLVAAEILKQLTTIPQQTYYLVDTPDGTLGRDINGFFTEAPIKTANLKVDSPCGKTESVQAQSLMGFGDMMKNQNAVALMKTSGQYGKLILMMKCGQCDYESPIETVAGDMERQCYSCGAKNKTHRGSINVYTENGAVEV